MLQRQKAGSKSRQRVGRSADGVYKAGQKSASRKVTKSKPGQPTQNTKAGQ